MYIGLPNWLPLQTPYRKSVQKDWIFVLFVSCMDCFMWGWLYFQSEDSWKLLLINCKAVWDNVKLTIVMAAIWPYSSFPCALVLFSRLVLQLSQGQWKSSFPQRHCTVPSNSSAHHKMGKTVVCPGWGICCCYCCHEISHVLETCFVPCLCFLGAVVLLPFTVSLSLLPCWSFTMLFGAKILVSSLIDPSLATVLLFDYCLVRNRYLQSPLNLAWIYFDMFDNIQRGKMVQKSM